MICPRFTEDFEEIADNSPPIWVALSPPLIANKNASFFITFWAIAYRDVTDPDNGISLLAIRGQVMGPVIPNYWSAIYGVS